MADTTNTPTCATCSKTAAESGGPLKRCAKCYATTYCSRDCQQADWKTHKKACVSKAAGAGAARNAGSETASAGSAPGSSSTPGLTGTVDKPFHRLHNKTWLHDRPRADVYKLLLDTYRFRMEDNFNLEGGRSADSLYGGAANGRSGFVRFLDLAEGKMGLLPPWWSAETRQECLVLGATPGWSSLAKKVTKAQVMAHYRNDVMPMQLRLFGEQVYGRGPGGQSGEMIIRMQMMTEGGGMHGSVIDASEVFGRR